MNNNSVKVRTIDVGSGIPKICVPIVSASRKALMTDISSIIKAKPDIIEYRADYMMSSMEELEEMLSDIRAAIGDTVLLFTIRTADEGGEADVDDETYEGLLLRACESGNVDMIDVEAYKKEGLLEKMCKVAHTNGVYVVASNHDFNKTPDENELITRLTYMKNQGADIPKIAVMPTSNADVITLLSATNKYCEKEGGPVITMSMSGKGVVSRLAGEWFGSAVTFATVTKASAPGQVPIDDVRNVLNVIHESIS